MKVPVGQGCRTYARDNVYKEVEENVYKEVEERGGSPEAAWEESWAELDLWQMPNTIILLVVIINFVIVIFVIITLVKHIVDMIKRPPISPKTQ